LISECFSWENNTSFKRANFAGSAQFLAPIFNDTVDFISVKFDQDISFKQAQFRGQASFEGSKFNGLAEFNECSFLEGASFGKSVFLNDIVFNSTVFRGLVDFAWSDFMRFADFSGSQFVSNADFSNTNFCGPADFSRSVFSEKANFHAAEFKRAIYLENCRINDLNLTNTRYKWLYLHWDSINHLEFDDAAYRMLINNYNQLQWQKDSFDCHSTHMNAIIQAAYSNNCPWIMNGIRSIVSCTHVFANSILTRLFKGTPIRF